MHVIMYYKLLFRFAINLQDQSHFNANL
jgi:hypothetical protein